MDLNSRLTGVGNLLLCIWCLLFILIFTSSLNAEDSSDIKLTPPQKRTIVIEEIYEYYIRKYAPPYKIQLLSSPREIIYDTPESVAIAHISAMLSADWDWFKSIMTKESQEIVDAINENNGITPEDTVFLWEKEFVDGKAELLTRIDRGDYVIIEYRIFAGEDKKTIHKGSITLTVEDGIWKRVHITGDPVHTNWRAAEETGKEYREKKFKVRTPEPHTNNAR